VFPANLAGEWVRVRTDADCPKATVYFSYGPGGGAAAEPNRFASLSDASEAPAFSSMTVRPLGGDSGSLRLTQAASKPGETLGAMDLSPDLHFAESRGPVPAEPADRGAAADYQVSADAASIIVTQKRHRFRLPVSNASADALAGGGRARHLREVVTERFLLNAGGSMFMVPRPTAGGAMRMKPICTHDKRIADFCSWRGMLVLAGARADSKSDGHTFTPGNGAAGVWLGDIDDLWRMGKPRGQGGPWLRTAVRAGEPSDPYLMAGYDKKLLELSHDSAAPVRFVVEVDYRADGTWAPYHTFEVPPGKPMMYEFPIGYSAQWVRFRCDSACNATARLVYN
jgi:hypothetical protein